MRSKLFIFTFLFLFFGARIAFAVAPSITNAPSTINTDTAFSLTTTMSGLSSNTVYRLRIALALPGTSNYFGSTFNNTGWYNGTPSPINYSNFLSITTDSTGSWSGNVQGKVESSDPNFSGSSATYDLKIGRYTETGTSPTWSSPLPIALVIPSPTPTSTPTPSPTPTPAPSPTPTTSPNSSSFIISNTPSQINSDQSFSASINLSLPNNQNSKFYLKGAFRHPDKPNNYFGFTKVGSIWVKNGTTATSQLQITTDQNGNWSGNVEIKPDVDDSGFVGSGDYFFKVARYDQNEDNLTWSNEATIKINKFNISSNSPAPQLTPTPSPKTSPQSQNLKSPSSRPSPSLKTSFRIASVAGVQTATPEGKVEVKDQKQSNPLIWIGLIFIFAGAGAVGYSIFKKNAKI